MRRALALAVFAAAATAAQTPHGDGAVGCYRLRHAAWPDSLGHLPSPARLPGRLELTSDPSLVGGRFVDGREERFVPEGLDGARAVRYPGLAVGAGPFSYWRVVDGEMILNRFLPTAGSWLRLSPARADDWQGTLTGFTGAIPPDGNASAEVAARLVREPCPPR